MSRQTSAFAAVENYKKNAAQFTRRSYLPSWMNNPSWVNSIELPQDYIIEFTREEIENYNSNNSLNNPSITNTSLLVSPRIGNMKGNNNNNNNNFNLVNSVRRTMALWVNDDEDEEANNNNNNLNFSQKRLMSLLTDVIKCITQRTPWDPPECNTPERKIMLAIVLKKFIDQSLDPVDVGLFAKDILRRISDTDVARELQYLYISFTFDKMWSGGDSYRRPENFIHHKYYNIFQEECLEEVKRRLHMLNTDLSGKEMNVAYAMTKWKEIHGVNRGKCFGGFLTFSLTNVQLRVVGNISNNKSKSKNDNQKFTLPKKIKAVWSLRKGNKIISSNFIPCIGLLKGNEYEWPKENRVTIIIPKGASENFKEYNIVLELIIYKQSCFCSTPQEKILASAKISVDNALYRNIVQPNSTLRTSSTFLLNRKQNNNNNEPFVNQSEKVIGYHFSYILLPSSELNYPCNIESAKAFCHMSCLDEEHNTRPPNIDIDIDEENEVESLVIDKKIIPSDSNLDSWNEDHHSSFLRLVEIINDIDDIAVSIFKAYCRRYLIHGELEKIAILSSVCTRSNLTDLTSQELCAHALASLVDINNNKKYGITTRVCEKIVKETIEITQSHIFDVILALEDINLSSSSASSPSSNKGNKNEIEAILSGAKKLLRILIITTIDKNIDIDSHITLAAAKEMQPISDALDKLDARLLREHRRSVSHTTLNDISIPELDRHADKAKLTGKARYLYELITHVMERCQRAVTFAKLTGLNSVQQIAFIRIEQMVQVVSNPLRNVITRILACLVRAPDPDPLGDTLGLLVLTYNSIMNLIDILDAEPNTSEMCCELSSCFNGFLSCWFPLCEEHISIWMSNITNNEVLEPIIPGNIYFSESPGLLLDLLQSLLAIFVRLLSWSDPRQHKMYAVHFFTLMQKMGEAFVDATVTQGRVAVKVEEWLVCLSNLQRYQQLIKEFGNHDVQLRLIKSFGDNDQVMEHQRKVIAEQTRALTMISEDEFIQYIQQSVEKSMISFLSFIITDSELLMKDLSFISSSEIRNIDKRFSNYIGEQLEIIKSNLDTNLFKIFFKEIIFKAYYGAFNQILLQNIEKQISESYLSLLMHLLHTLDEELELYENDIMKDEFIILKQRNTKILTILLGQSSEMLIQMTKTKELDEFEQTQINFILQSRTDIMAKQYIKNSI